MPSHRYFSIEESVDPTSARLLSVIRASGLAKCRLALLTLCRFFMLSEKTQVAKTLKKYINSDIIYIMNEGEKYISLSPEERWMLGYDMSQNDLPYSELPKLYADAVKKHADVASSDLDSDTAIWLEKLNILDGVVEFCAEEIQDRIVDKFNAELSAPYLADDVEESLAALEDFIIDSENMTDIY